MQNHMIMFVLLSNITFFCSSFSYLYESETIYFFLTNNTKSVTKKRLVCWFLDDRRSIEFHE